MTSLPLSCSQLPLSLQNSLLTIKFPSSNFQTRPQKSQVIRCNAENDKNAHHFDRRNLLVGMGGLYGAASSLDSPLAFATPISGPDFSKCTNPRDVFSGETLDESCCLPLPDGIIDYKLPPVTAMRFRPAAHLASKDYIAKYEKALKLMKDLPPEDPRNFIQQANVHCAYCNLTLPQTGNPDQKLQIHFNWLFFPWHRWYLYFYERILGSLIDDPTFGLPFWNWDHPDGMVMPEMFNKEGSTLYGKKRDQRHRPGNGSRSIADLRYDLDDKDRDRTIESIILRNLQQVQSEMVGAKSLFDFYGAKYVTGSESERDTGMGSVERGSHTALHLWVGDPTQPNNENMGNFYSAGREPLFFSHHANIDRLWSVYQELQASRGKPGQFETSEWLDANFLFYDENLQLVRVRVGDALHNQQMGYTFQKVDNPWMRYKSERREKPKPRRLRRSLRDDNPVFPVKLDKVVRVLVDRPRKSMSKEEKEREEELLVVEGIEVDSTKFVRFEVYVNDEDDKWKEVADIAEYVGNYSQVPHKSSGGEVMKSKIRLGLREVLEGLDADDDDKILVSLVPQAGGKDVIIGGIKIIYDDEADE